jgi:hypothetical protein
MARGSLRSMLTRHVCLLLQLQCLLLLPSHSIRSEAAGQHAGTRCTYPSHPPSSSLLCFSSPSASSLHCCTSLLILSTSPLLFASSPVRPPFLYIALRECMCTVCPYGSAGSAAARGLHSSPGRLSRCSTCGSGHPSGACPLSSWG